MPVKKSPSPSPSAARLEFFWHAWQKSEEEFRDYLMHTSDSNWTLESRLYFHAFYNKVQELKQVIQAAEKTGEPEVDYGILSRLAEIAAQEAIKHFQKASQKGGRPKPKPKKPAAA